MSPKLLNDRLVNVFMSVSSISDFIEPDNPVQVFDMDQP